ncbi:hypothetical protein [Piscinibacter sp. XHJ-5]|uniref:hypothetical protein n=1 Tax=Piscinibacter sp. XHJ-5 TaxID=3037797 RepID=UPI002452A778|nr:hypothetical protein [Piscinibacter sp. XHJ-5]
MSAVGSTLDAMGVEQYLLAFLFLVSYTFALSDFIGVRGRHYAVMAALTSAFAFAMRTDPWMHGVLVVVVAMVAIGAFAGIVWGLWAAFGWPHSDMPVAERLEAPPAPLPDETLSLGAAAAAAGVLHRPANLAGAGDTQR